MPSAAAPRLGNLGFEWIHVIVGLCLTPRSVAQTAERDACTLACNESKRHHQFLVRSGNSSSKISIPDNSLANADAWEGITPRSDSRTSPSETTALDGWASAVALASFAQISEKLRQFVIECLGLRQVNDVT